ncbi:MAG TPA: M1 family metallopeptidase, partial [Candidatus Acidoferrales bacterium]
MADSPWRAVPPWRTSFSATMLLALALFLGVAGRADEPYARSRTYDLQNARLEMRFDLDSRSVHGTATHTLAPLGDALRRVEFDAVDLTIEGVRVGGRAARFEQSTGKLYVTLDQPAPAGRQLEIEIHYSARPRKGMTFILPDAHYPQRPAHIWTQGQSEEMRYWAPIYDYPNDLTASETIITVPAHWQTLSNGVLVSTTDAPNQMKTWHWRQSKPHATYLISVVAGEFEKTEETWRGIPVSYYVLRGEGARIPPTFSRTRKMLDFFSGYYGAEYPWEKYAQIGVEGHFGGMEHTSATTLTHSYMLHPELAADAHKGPDFLLAHELAHQWFGDLVTCKDWANLWINEGFATHAEILWDQHHFSADEGAFTLWNNRNDWFASERLFTVPLTTRDISDAFQYSGNTYGKAGWVVEMLRRELGEDHFRKSLRHFLAVHRHQNVVSADLVRAIEQATGRNLDPFFDQWVHGAGAPRFEVRARWEPEQRRVVLTVKQTQKVEGAVGLFRVPVEVEITTPQGRVSHLITVSKADEVFTLPAPEQP